MTGETLLRWARREAMAWFDTRHDTNRESLDEFVARVYLQGQIDALKDEIIRKGGTV